MKDLHSLPKTDLHRHLEGSIRPVSAWHLARQHGQIDRKVSLETFRAGLVIDAPLPLLEALERFDRCRAPIIGRDAVKRIAREAVLDAAADAVDHLELRFSPFTLARAAGLTIAEVFAAVHQGAVEGQQLSKMALALVVVVSRGRGLDAAWEVARAVQSHGAGWIAGADLASDELRHRTAEFADVAKALVEQGLSLTVHTGEGAGPAHVAEALALPGVRRLGHALSLVDDAGLLAEAVSRGLMVEVCPTSNIRAGVVKDLASHPARRMLEAGLDIAICSDDPCLFAIDLSHELALAHKHFGLDIAALTAMQAKAAHAMFQPPSAPPTAAM